MALAGIAAAIVAIITADPPRAKAHDVNFPEPAKHGMDDQYTALGFDPADLQPAPQSEGRQRREIDDTLNVRFHSPTSNDTAIAGVPGSGVSIAFSLRNAPEHTHLDFYLFNAGGFNRVARFAHNVSVTNTSWEYTPPSNLASGDYWIACTESGQGYITGAAPDQHGAEHYGARTFSITASLCSASGGHGACAGDEYCDRDGKCWYCGSCAQAFDAYDMFCPDKCGGPTTYIVGNTIPNTTEIDASGEVRDVVRPGCSRYDQLVTHLAGNPQRFRFLVDELGTSNLMTARLSAKLSLLVQQMDLVDGLVGLEVGVAAAYRSPPSNVENATLHHEGRAALITLRNADRTPELMVLFVATCGATGFDFVEFRSHSLVYVSVVPDACTTPVDLMFLLDASESIDIPFFGGELGTFTEKVLGFVQEVIPFFTLGLGVNASRIGVATFSETATLHAALNAFTNPAALSTHIAGIPYDAKDTRTSVGLGLIRANMMSAANGLRPLSAGVSRVLIVVTDGVSSSGFEPADEAGLIQDENVNVFAMGVGNGINVSQLHNMASSADNVYEIKSFARVIDIVAAISSKACDAPAVLTAGEQTTTTVQDCEIKYYRPECLAASGSTLQITVTTISGSVEVYVALASSHPGPFNYDFKDDSTDVEKIIFVDREDGLSGNIVVGIKGTSSGVSSFALDVWSDIFRGETLHIDTWPENTAAGAQIYSPPLTFTGSSNRATTVAASTTAPTTRPLSANVRLMDGGSDYEGRVEVLVGGTWGTVCDNSWGTADAEIICAELGFSGGTSQIQATFGQGVGPIHFNDVRCAGNEYTVHNCLKSTITHTCDHSEDAGVACADPEATTTAASGGALPTDYQYSIRSGNEDDDFDIDPATGIVSIGPNGLDYETTTAYTLRILGQTLNLPCQSGFMDLRINVGNINDNRPELLPPIDREGVYVSLPAQTSISEATPSGSFVLQIRATDRDGDVLSYELQDLDVTQAALTAFRINSQTGAIYTATALDYETRGNYMMAVTVSDNGIPAPFTVSGNVTVTVLPEVCPSGTFSLASTGTHPCDSTDECTGAQFQTAPPTLNSNRVCSSLTAPCAVGDSYETVAATETSDRECTPQPICSEAQYERIAPTLTMARSCSNLTVCSDDEYQTAAPTLTINRVCADLSACTANADGTGSYEARAATADTDRLCRSLTRCTDVEYEISPPSAMSDRRCAAQTECNVTTMFQSAAPTATTDRNCTGILTCTVSEYQTAEPTVTSDRNCTGLDTCSRSEYQTVAHSTTTDRSCAALTTCNISDGLYQETAPTITSNRVCTSLTPCLSDEFESRAATNVRDRTCSPLSVCSDVQFVLLQNTATSDRVCSGTTVCNLSVNPATYQTHPPTESSDRECGEVTICLSAEYESIPPSILEDRNCATISTCTDSQWETGAPTTSSNRICRAAAVCDTVTEWESTAVTRTSDRLCSGLETCSSTQFVLVAPSAISDRICSDLAVCSLPGQFEAVGATATSNRECQSTSVCGTVTGTYETVTETATSDRVCTPLTTCTAGAQYQARLPAYASDRICANVRAPCTPNEQWESHAPSATSDRVCPICTRCKTRQFESTAPTITSDRACQNITICEEAEFEVVPLTVTSDRSCAPLTNCSNGNGLYQETAPTITSDRTCAVLSECTEDQFESRVAAAASNRICTNVRSPCTPNEQWESHAPSATSDCVCPICTRCKTRQFESTAPTTTSDRACENITTCEETEFEVAAATESSNRNCSALSVCEAGVAYENQAPTTTSDRDCLAYSGCDLAVQFEALAATATSDRTCSTIRRCGFEVSPPTATTNRICGPNPIVETTADDDTVSSSLIVVMVVAIALILVLMAMVDRFQREGPKRTEHADPSARMDGDPMHMISNKFSFGAPSGLAIAMVADAAAVPAALTQRGDKLWMDFRRATSFDHQYCGNPPMELGDDSLEDVYALLAITCPPRSFFGPLRGVGERFLEQEVQFNATNEGMLDDVVDYIGRALPDVFLEQATDMCTLLEHWPDSSDGDEGTLTMFCAMVDDYSPEDNVYLVPGSGGDSGRRLMRDAADRELHQVDPIYFEAEAAGPLHADDDAHESSVRGHVGLEAMYDAGSSADSGLTYAVGNSGMATYENGDGVAPARGMAIYDNGNGGALPTRGMRDDDDAHESGVRGHVGLEAMYDAGSSADSGLTYAVGNSGMAIYDIVDGVGAPARGMAIYDNGNGGAPPARGMRDDDDAHESSVKGTVGLEAVYDAGSSADSGLTYTVGNSGMAIYDNGDEVGAPARGMAIYDNGCGDIYGTASGAEPGSGMLDRSLDDAVYDTAKAFTGTASYDIAKGESGATLAQSSKQRSASYTESARGPVRKNSSFADPCIECESAPIDIHLDLKADASKDTRRATMVPAPPVPRETRPQSAVHQSAFNSDAAVILPGARGGGAFAADFAEMEADGMGDALGEKPCRLLEMMAASPIAMENDDDTSAAGSNNAGYLKLVT